MTITSNARKSVCSGTLAFLAVGVLAGAAYGQSLPPRVMVGASQAGTLQHSMAAGLARVATDFSDTTLVVQPFGGATAILPLLNDGELDFGVAPSVDFGLSYMGPERLQIDGRNPYPDGSGLRLVMAGSPLVATLIVRADSDIRSANDLAGRRVAGGFPAQLGAFVNTYAHLLSAGLSWDDVTAVPFTTLNDSLDAVIDGSIDATVFGVGAPRVREADATVGLRFVSSDCSDEGIARVTAEIPGYFMLDRAADSSPAIREDICTTGYQMYLVTHADADDTMVRAVLEALWNNLDELPQYHPSLRAWNAAAAVPDAPTIPFHPAAVTFYQEVGAWEDGMDAIQEQLLAR
ncbi:MAG: TAXI family TRAP transporter solute-binding subunit [Pararhodobacter sp.]